MKVNYEQIVKAHQNQPGNAALQVSDEIKFKVVCHAKYFTFAIYNVCSRYFTKINHFKRYCFSLLVPSHYGFIVCVLQLWNEHSQFHRTFSLCFQLAGRALQASGALLFLFHWLLSSWTPWLIFLLSFVQILRDMVLGILQHLKNQVPGSGHL